MPSPPAEAAAARNRRLCPRFPATGCNRFECRAGTLGLGPDLCLAVLDLSETGAGVILRSAVPDGQEVEVVMSAAGMNKPLKRLAKVVWSQPLEGNGVRAGLQFERRLPFAELQRFIRVDRRESPAR
jgi:hypothetical protein